MIYALAVFIHSVFVIHKLTTASEHKDEIRYSHGTHAVGSKKALEEERERQSQTGFNQTEIDGYSGFIFQNRYGECMSSYGKMICQTKQKKIQHYIADSLRKMRTKATAIVFRIKENS